MLAAVWLGVGSFAPPSPRLGPALAAAAALIALLATRSPTVRRLAAELIRGLGALLDPRSIARRVLPWQFTGRLLRVAAVWCFLRAFGLPTEPAGLSAAGGLARGVRHRADGGPHRARHRHVDRRALRAREHAQAAYGRAQPAACRSDYLVS